MAGQADGSIIIDTELDSKGFKAGSAELLSAIKSLNGRVQKLQKQMQKVGEQKIASDEYKQVQQDIAQAEKDLAQYNQRLAKLSEKGKVDTAEWDALTADIKAANAELSRLRTLKAAMEQDGTAYVSGTQTAEYQSMNAALTASKQRLVELQAELARVNSAWAQMPTLTGYVRSAILSIGSSVRSAFGTVTTAITHPLQAADRIFGLLLQKAGQFVRIVAKFSVNKLVSGLKSAASSMTGLVTKSKALKNPLESVSWVLRRIAPSLLMTEGLFGLLRKAVNAFLQENQQLASQLNSCWAGIGNILGPIITRLINLVSTAVAYVTQFLALLGFVGKSTTKAISSAGGAASKESDKLKRQLASFDELNILSDSSSDSAGGGGSSTPTAETPDVTLPDWVKTMVDHLKSGEWSAAAIVLTEQLNNMVASVDWAGVGTNIAYWLDGALEFLATAILTFDWYNLGVSLGKMVNSLIHGVDWANLGIVLGWKFIALIEGLGGLFATIDWIGLGKALADGFMGLWNAIDWKQAARTLSTGIIGALNGLSAAIRNVDWQKLGNDVATFVANIDWSGVITALFNGIGAAFGGLGGFVWGLVEAAFGSLVGMGQKNAELYGTDIVSGIIIGILMGIANIGQWIVDNIFTPFINGFKAAFGINSPSTVMQEQGGFIIQGLYNGITTAWASITQFFSTALTTLQGAISGAWSKVEELTSKAWNKVSGAVGNAWESAQKWTKDTVENVKSKVSDGWENIKKKTSTIWSSVTDTVGDAWSDVKKWVSNNGSDVEKSNDVTWTRVESVTRSVNTNVKNIVSNNWTQIKNNIASKHNAILSNVSASWSSIRSVMTSYNSSILSSVTSAWSQMSSNVAYSMSSIKSNVSSTFNSLVSSAYTWGSHICDNLASGMYSGQSRVASAASSLARTIQSYVGFSEPEKGPLSNFHTYMPDMVDLMVKGMENNKARAAAAAAHIAGAISREVQSGNYAISSISAAGQADATMAAFSDKITTGFADLVSRLQAIANGVTFAIPNVVTGVAPYAVTADVDRRRSASGDTSDPNNDISSVVIQSVNNATLAIVKAIEDYSTTNVTIDSDSLTDRIIAEINRRTRMSGKSPLIG